MTFLFINLFICAANWIFKVKKEIQIAIKERKNLTWLFSRDGVNVNQWRRIHFTGWSKVNITSARSVYLYTEIHASTDAYLMRKHECNLRMQHGKGKRQSISAFIIYSCQYNFLNIFSIALCNIIIYIVIWFSSIKLQCQIFQCIRDRTCTIIHKYLFLLRINCLFAVY